MSVLELGKIGKIVKFAQDDFMVSEGENGDSMYIILDGSAHVYISSYMDSPIKIHELEKGDFFGEMALLENEPRSASIIATEDITAIKIDQSNFEDLLKHHPDISMRMLRSLSNRLRKTNEELSNLRTKIMDNTNYSPESIYKSPQSGDAFKAKDTTCTNNDKFHDKQIDNPQNLNEHQVDYHTNLNENSHNSINILSILPKQHNRYKLDLYTDTYNNKVLHKKIVCPICKMVFETDLIKTSKLQLEKEDKFFRKIYTHMNPLANNIWTCPSCLYSKTFFNFHSVPTFKKDAIQNLLIQLKHNYTFNNNNTDDINKIFIKYYLAIYIEENAPRPNIINLAKYWLNLYWLYSDVKDSKMTEFALNKTHKYYKEAYYASKLNISALEEIKLAILVSELCFALGEYKDSYNLLSKLILDKNLPAYLKQKISNLMYEARNSLKNNETN